MNFLSYLTLPNPEVDSTLCKGGYTTKNSRIYRPTRVKPWTDFTIENFNASFKDIVLHEMAEPKVRNARDITPERTIIYEESGVTDMVAHWNERVVQHALNGTQPILHREMPGQRFDDGSMYFSKNRGQGHVLNHKNVEQKPDWCLSRVWNHKINRLCKNYLPGDSKPAKKWNSEWIGSQYMPHKKKSNEVLAQINKYMSLCETRYGFIISEHEVVAMRLSKCKHEKEVPDNNQESLEELESDENEEAAQFGTLLEYCPIPWATSGTGNLTVNLSLWWLSVLAFQENSIQDEGTYGSLGTRSRGTQPLQREHAASLVSKERKSAGGLGVRKSGRIAKRKKGA
ncbi:hypothetical protein F4802DRAFT_620682 [Xylaria palmicola]|nr:hypothetical protein F4802DRAFT_620682 [Xylaria palmicola]